MSWKTKTLKAIAWMVRADPYEEFGGIDSVIEREDPSALLERLSAEATDEDGDLAPHEITEEACGVAPPIAVIESAIASSGDDRADLLGGRLSDEELEEMIDKRDLWPDPIDRVARMPDEPRTCYGWVLSDDATEEDRQSLANEIEAQFIREHKNEPQALHLIVNNVDDIREFTAAEIKDHVKPWLRGTEFEDNKTE